MNRLLLCLIIVAAPVLLIVSCKKEEDIDNKVPVANAGPSQNVTLPFSSITLTGSGTDEDGQIVAYLWSQVSGTNTPLIANPGSASTTVSGFVAGNYVFQLMVTDDDGATGVDTLTVKVNPAPEMTLTLQPANNPNEVALAIINGVNGSGNGWIDLSAVAWTTGGNPVTLRSLLKFDLSSIPQTATIVSANLNLYSHPAPTPEGNLVDANFGTNNSMVVQRVVSDWSPLTVTWFNQPAGASQNQVVVPHTSASSLDLTIDVTNLVSTMVSTNSNYGFLTKLQNEVAYTSRVFISSRSPLSATKFPKLVVVYR
ncbi:MAG TPA: DNRLRE domain-containing protein [Chitinophagaceae bacterium]|nr:DNRLRE domain-containing protein [Chitinophagaceae bacterium]